MGKGLRTLPSCTGLSALTMDSAVLGFASPLMVDGVLGFRQNCLLLLVEGSYALGITHVAGRMPLCMHTCDSIAFLSGVHLFTCCYFFLLRHACARPTINPAPSHPELCLAHCRPTPSTPVTITRQVENTYYANVCTARSSLRQEPCARGVLLDHPLLQV